MDSSHSQHSGANVPWTPPSPEELAVRLPAYEVVEILGRGGMGAVYKARQKSLKRWVAIKLLPLVAADDELKFAERFRNEAETMAQMNHPSIVNVYDFGETSDGLLYIVMEFVDGTDVQKMIHGSGLLSGDYALAITAHVCDALAYAHARGVIHRDIKPANILIDQEGNVKVADFGLAKMTDIDYGLTQSNVAMGTPDYVAPEVLSYGMVADHRADLYAIGVMLYQMLTGEVPRGLFKMPSQKGIGSDPRFDDIICKAMEPDRDERYQSATDVRQALDVILTTALPKVEEVEESTSAAKSIRFQYAPPQRNAEVMDGETRSPAKAPPKRQAAEGSNRGAPTPVRKSSSAGLWLGISGLVAVIGVAGFLILGGKSKSAPESASTKSTSSSQPGKVPPQTVPPRSEPATGKTIDLLALVDVKRDTVAGKWERTSDGLVKTGGSATTQGAPRLQLPYQPPAEYDFEVEFTAVGDNQTVGQMISTQSRMFSWILGGNSNEEPTAGFEMFDRKPTSQSSEAAVRMQNGLEKGRRHRSRVEVRAGGLRGFFDDVELVDWRGDFNRLAIDAPSKLRDDNHLGLRAARDVVFHKITVREITGTGKADAGTAKTSSVSAKTIDLLPLVDPSRDAVVGKWSQSANGLSVAAGDQTTTGKGSLRLQLPYQPPEEYDFEIEFTASAATGRSLGQILSASARNFSLLWAGGAESQPLAGFEMLDGLSTSRQPTTIKPLPGGIESGRRYRSRVEVRRDSMRAFLDDKEVVSWKGSFSSLSIDEENMLRDELHLGLRTSRPVTYHKITVREITGTGKVDAAAAIDAPPVITNWQDVTGTVRETARGTSGLSVDNDGTIRHSPDGRFPKLTLTKPDQRDNAVRVRYTGEVQIGFRSNTTNMEYLFVLCEANQTIFAKFHGDEAKKSEKIGLTKTHPSIFEPDHEHELLVTMQGTRFRAWMDGVFWGEGNDGTLTEGTTVLMFTPKMVVKNVEIAELAPSPSYAAAVSQTFQGHRYQFVAGDYTWTEAKAAAEKLGGHLAVITSAEENDWAWKTFSSELPQLPKENRWMRGWWLGGSQTALEKPWSWLNNESMTVTHWGPGEPKASISPPRYLWMSDANKEDGTSNWSAQNGWTRGGFLVEWDTLVATQD